MRFPVIYLFMLAAGQAAIGAVCLVDITATGADDGSTWPDAYTRLQDALADSGCSEIRVAEGVYRPDQGANQTPGDRNATFQLKDDVTLLGGFPTAGGEVDDRCAELNETILSGDLNDDDDTVGNQDNSLHVVTGNGTGSTAVLDGFTITAGHADGGPNDGNNGAGMLNVAGSPTVIDCTFVANSALHRGGGLYNRDASPTVTGCKFLDNSADTLEGGGVYNWRSATPLTNCVFDGNVSPAGTGGGGMAVVDSPSPDITNCTFHGNSSGGTQGGGGIWVSNSSPSVTNSILWNNSDLGGTNESAQIHITTGSPTVNYSCVQGLTGGLGGVGNIGSDPQLTDLRLAFGSPAIDAGDDLSVPVAITEDIEHRPRFQPGDPTGAPPPNLVDMGAHEYAYLFTYSTHGFQLQLDTDLDVLEYSECLFGACSLFSESSEDPDPPQWLHDQIAAINARAPFANARAFSWNSRSGNWGSGWAIASGQHLAGIVYTDVQKYDLQHVHLIGHSRGSGVITEAVRRLGSLGIGVSDGRTIHKTMLDPVDGTDHGYGGPCQAGNPNGGLCCSYMNVLLESIQNFADPAIQTYSNETRSDGYHRLVCSIDPFPRGTPIDGAANQNVGALSHSGVHTPWYLDSIQATQLNPVCADCMGPPFIVNHPDGYYWSIGGGGWNDCRLDCRVSGPITALPAASSVDWVPNGDFSERAPVHAGSVPVWTGYRWEDPICPGQWEYVNGVDPDVDLVLRSGSSDNYAAEFDTGGGTLVHQPILIPPGASTLRFEMFVSGAPGPAEPFRVLFDGEEIWSAATADHNSGCFERICVDISGYVGRVGTLGFEYAGGGADVNIDNIQLSFSPCTVFHPGIAINEVWAADPPPDDVEFIELVGPSGAGLGGMSLIVVDGDTDGNPGSEEFRRIDYRHDYVPCAVLGDPEGRLVMGAVGGIENVHFPVGTLENGSQTYALVRTVDIEEIGGQLTQPSVDAITENLIDAVATLDQPIDHVYFGAPVVEHLGTAAGHMHRIPDGVDTDGPADWMTQAGIEFGFPGDVSTPGATNMLGPVPTPGESTQLMVAGYDPGSGELSISYGPACSVVDHQIEFGPLANVDTYSYTGQDCSIGTSGLYDGFRPGDGSYFFVVVGVDGLEVAGSYGLSSAGERPEAPDTIFCPSEQDLSLRCDAIPGD